MSAGCRARFLSMPLAWAPEALLRKGMLAMLSWQRIDLKPSSVAWHTPEQSQAASFNIVNPCKVSGFQASCNSAQGVFCCLTA